MDGLHRPIGKQNNLVQGRKRTNTRLGGVAELFNSLSHKKKLMDFAVHARMQPRPREKLNHLL